MSETMATAPEGEMATSVGMPDEVPISLPDPRDYVDPEAETEASNEAPEGTSSEAPAEPEPPEEVEFDLGGTKIKAPKGALPEDVADAIQKWTKTAWANHTARSQEVAEQRRAVEQEFQQAQQFRQLGDELRDKFATGWSMRQQLDQWKQSFDERLWDSNPNEARRQSDLAARMERQILGIAEEVQRAETTLEQAQRERATQAQRGQMEAFERSVQEGRKAVLQAIPNFDAQAEADLISYAVKIGVDAEAAKNWSSNPAVAIAFHKAMQFDRAQTAGSAALKPVAPNQPVKAMAGNGAATPSDPSQMTTAQMAQHLKARGIIR